MEKRNSVELVENPEDADVGIVFIYPKSGNYFSATPGLLELSLTEGKTITAMDGSTYQETTVANINRVEELSKILRDRDKKLVISVNAIMAWLLDSIEPLADGLVAHFETLIEAQLDVFTGVVKLSGLLPMTLPAGEEVIAVDENGKCVSRNDVPGYDKDQYMPEGMKYAYVDEMGNKYRLGFGLSYE